MSISPVARLVVPLAAISAVLAGCGQSQAPAQSAPPPPQVSVAKPTKKMVTDHDEYVGRFIAFDYVEVRARVSGYLDKILFKDGQLVKEGDPLFIIDRRPFEATVEQSKAAVEQAKANLAFAESDLKRGESLRTGTTITQQALDQRLQASRVAAASVTAQEAAELNRETVLLKERIANRAREVQKLLQQTPLELLRFADGKARLTEWQPFDLPAGGKLEQSNSRDGKRSLAIVAGPVTSASWRTKVLLPPGRYRFEASVLISSVAAMGFGKNHGATLRVSGAPAPRPAGLLGTQSWKPMQVAFETTAPEQEVELICDLRASKGTAWFDLESLRLVRER